MSYPTQDTAVGRRIWVLTHDEQQYHGVLLRRDDDPESHKLVVQVDDGRVLVGGEIRSWGPLSGDHGGYEIAYVVTVAVTSDREVPAEVGAYVRQSLRTVDLPLSAGNARVSGVEYLEHPPAPRFRWMPLWWVRAQDGRITLWRGLFGDEPEGWNILCGWSVEEALLAHQRVLASQPLHLSEMGLVERPGMNDWLVRNQVIDGRPHWVWSFLDQTFAAPVVPGVAVIPPIPDGVVQHEAAAITKYLSELEAADRGG